MKCCEKRWSSAGRLVARARAFRVRPRSGQVLRQRDWTPDYPPGRAEGPWVALDVGATVALDMREWLSRRLTSLEVHGEQVWGLCDWMHEGDALIRGGVLVAELRDHFNLRVSVGVARSVEAAVVASALAMPLAVVAVEPGCEARFTEPFPYAPLAQQELFQAGGV